MVFRDMHEQLRSSEGGTSLGAMRAAELAAGYIVTLLNDFPGIVISLLLHDPLVARLDAEGKAMMLREFAILRRHICVTFTVKLACWCQNFGSWQAWRTLIVTLHGRAAGGR